MADKDNKQGPLAKVLQKHAGRAKERILQNLGKADRTTDVDFDVCVKNVSKLQGAATKLQKEFKNYYQCLRALQASRKCLIDTVNELYEPCWGDVDNFCTKSEVLNQNLDDFCEKVNNQLLTPVASYMSQFPELNTKIAKRNRKLLDYDNCRHNLQNIETVKKREEAKITKAKEQLEEARNLFEVINSELHDEIPALYESRVSFFVSNLQCLYLAEAHFHNQDATIFLELNSLLEAVAEANNKVASKKKISSGFQDQDVKDEPELEPEQKSSQPSIGDESSSGSASGSAIFSTPPTTTSRNKMSSSPEEANKKSKKEEHPRIEEQRFDNNTTADTAGSESYKHKEQHPLIEDCRFDNKAAADTAGSESHKHKEGPLAECVPDSNATGDTAGSESYRYLYKVQGTYRYNAEDVDELSFNVGDVIDVIAYDDPEEQEEGWLLGVFNGKKGLFPANFTSRI